MDWALADEFDLTITVTHYPTSASKWNPVEHRLFSPISSNWAGQPLCSFETVLKFIRTTRTETGLRCWAHLDTREYATGLKVTKEQKAVRKEAESLFKNFRAGEKLTTDDILLLQRSKLI